MHGDFSCALPFGVRVTLPYKVRSGLDLQRLGPIGIIKHDGSSALVQLCLIKHLLDVVRLLLDQLVVSVLLVRVHSLLLQALVNCFEVDLLRGFVRQWIPAIVLPVVERLVRRMLIIESLIEEPLLVVVEGLSKLILRWARKLWFLIENYSLTMWGGRARKTNE